MKGFYSIFVTVILIFGCQRTLEPLGGGAMDKAHADKFGKEKIGSLTLVASVDRALVAADCQGDGGAACPRLPNEQDCNSLDVTVFADATLSGICKIDSGDGEQEVELNSIAEGLPVMAVKEKDSDCVVVVDDKSYILQDTCNRHVLYAEQLSTNPDYIFESSGAKPATPTPGTNPAAPVPAVVTPGSLDCTAPTDPRAVFACELNSIFAREGLLQLKYSPGMGASYQAGFFETFGGVMADLHYNPQQFFNTVCLPEAMLQGRCYCFERTTEVKPTCYVSRMTMEATNKANSKVGTSTGDTTARDQIFTEKQQALRWLIGGTNAPSYDKGGSKVEIPASQRITLVNVKGPGDMTGSGTPLILDLKGDGIALTSSKDGVDFDLLGVGGFKTSWTAGGTDDAFLAIDLNGNRKIDGGRELFGDGTMIDGTIKENGFQALALLDKPAFGGNGDQLVDRKDKMFAKLLLWSDRNHDGVSQSDELVTPKQAGIRSLSLGYDASGIVLDSHGNDLSLRGQFTRTNGSTGAMVDVFLRSQSLAISFDP